MRSGVHSVGRGAIDNFVFVVAFLRSYLLLRRLFLFICRCTANFFVIRCAVGFFFFVVGSVGSFVCRYAVEFFSFVIVTLIYFRLSLRHRVLFVYRCAIWSIVFVVALLASFFFVCRSVVNFLLFFVSSLFFLLGCWSLFVCRCGVGSLLFVVVAFGVLD